jgi:hypothetical protein
LKRAAAVADFPLFLLYKSPGNFYFCKRLKEFLYIVCANMPPPICQHLVELENGARSYYLRAKKGEMKENQTGNRITAASFR